MKIAYEHYNNAKDRAERVGADYKLGITNFFCEDPNEEIELMKRFEQEQKEDEICWNNYYKCRERLGNQYREDFTEEDKKIAAECDQALSECMGIC